MGKRRKRPPTPIALLWTRRDQLRFIDAVERFCCAVNDLQIVAAMLSEDAKRRPRKPTRKAVIPDQAGNGADQ